MNFCQGEYDVGASLEIVWSKTYQRLGICTGAQR
jgi:hypothetical protein